MSTTGRQRSGRASRAAVISASSTGRRSRTSRPQRRHWKRNTRDCAGPGLLRRVALPQDGLALADIAAVEEVIQGPGGGRRRRRTRP
jgi:hypothetical protein